MKSTLPESSKPNPPLTELPPKTQTIHQRGAIPSFLQDRRIVAVALLVLGLAVSAVGWNLSHSNRINKAESDIHPVLTVKTERPVNQFMESELAVNGTITAWDASTVGATTNGLEIKQVLVEEGDRVKKGQTLAILDSSQLVPQLHAEKAKLASDEATVRKSVQPNRPEDIRTLAAAVNQARANAGDAQAAVAQTKASLADASLSVSRYRTLVNEGAVSVQDADTRETAEKVWQATYKSALEKAKVAEALLVQAQERLQMAKKGGNLDDIDVAKANAELTRNNVKKLEADLDKTVIKAPVDGLIAERNAHVGDISVAGKSLFSIVRDNRLELKALVPEKDLHLIQPGQSVTMVSSLLLQPIDGKVREISPTINPDTRLATVRIDVPEKAGLKAGTYVDGHIRVGKHMSLSVPLQAVISKDDANIIFVLGPGGKVQSRLVTIGAQTNKLAEIISGLSTSDDVVVAGAGFLKDGDYVRIGTER